MKHFIYFICLSLSFLYGQIDTCITPIQKYTITSKYLEEARDHWVSLPMHYDSTKVYPVMYILDAEWRFDLVRTVVYDLSGNKKMPGHIIVGIPNIDWKFKRGIDLTFSHSRTEYDGDTVDSTWYNPRNSGGGKNFYSYLTKELIPQINSNYKTSDNVLVGHSYGGYFGGYILTLNHPFSSIHIYDPAMWYSNGEVNTRLKEYGVPKQTTVKLFIGYQGKPTFHKEKIEQFTRLLAKHPQLKYQSKRYINETHNSLYLYSFLDAIEFIYQ
mgnify:CR=1 FL=1